MDFERRRRPVQEINLTALIDIVFHLLVFVMLSTTFVVSESMELSLPSARSAVAEPTAITRILIGRDGRLWLDQTPMTADSLNVALAERLGADPETRIAIFTSPGVSVQQLVNVMDTVYLTGGKNVQVDKLQ